MNAGKMKQLTHKRSPVLIAYAMLMLVFAPLTSASDHKALLSESWQHLLQRIQLAEQHLTDPRSFPPEATDRNLAEGYRYLFGHLGRLIEREMRMDPQFPEFFRSVDMLRKWTAENPDAKYLNAPIDGKGYFRVSGTVANTQEWITSERGVVGKKAPRFVTFQTITEIPGNTGGLKEMADCTNQTLDFINSFDLDIDKSGSFELLIGPERPTDYNGNFLLSKKEITYSATKSTSMRHAQYLSVREIFSDWQHESSLDMKIVRVGSEGLNRPPITSDWMRKKIDKIANDLPNQILFWQLLQEFPLELRRDSNGDGKRNMPVNGIYQPSPPFTAGGVAGAQQLYSGGIFDLAEDEALLVKVNAPLEPHYIGFQLHTLWFEGPDQQNFTSSLSGSQLPVASDGSRYYIIAHRDPGVAGWMDTTGLDWGSFSMRFIFRETPDAQHMPTTSASIVKLEDLLQHLPKDTPQVSPEQRRKEIAIRQSHIKARWRGH